ncbi:MAG TPA: dipeptidase [Actinomycetota bacterium]|nr:dipeptidase [Actinomycetota bacterium]
MDKLTPDEARTRVSRSMPDVRSELEQLVRIPSISADGFDPAEVRRSAELTAGLLEERGLQTRLLEVKGAHPAVLATRPAPPGRPTLLLYAHHDVQPTGPVELWQTDPFKPVEKDGRLFGRGTSDDKAGIVIHTGALRAWDDAPPVGITVLVEGEEEIGSLHLTEFLDAYADLLRADVVILADSANWSVGRPALTTSLRGLVDCVVEVRTLDHAVHSGEFGGAVPDAVIALSRLLASLHDDEGNVAVAGLVETDADPLDLTEEELRAWAGVRPGVHLIGRGSLTSRTWTRPSVSVLGIDAPAIGEATNQLVPSARAKVSMRLAPGQDPATAAAALADHLRAHAPWGAEVTVTDGAGAAPYRVVTKGPAYDAIRRSFSEAWNVAPVEQGTGGTIPLVAAFMERYPDAAMLLTGAGDPTSNPHSENESVDLDELERSVVAEALFVGHLAGGE